MGTSVLVVLAAAALLAAGDVGVAGTVNRPNILFFMADVRRLEITSSCSSLSLSRPRLDCGPSQHLYPALAGHATVISSGRR